MEQSLRNLLSTGKYPTIWEAIAENRLEDAKIAVEGTSVTLKKSLLRFLKKGKHGRNDYVLQIASRILEPIPGKRLPKIKLSIEKNEWDQFAELIRLLFALHLNGNFTSDISSLSEIILELLADLTEQVSIQAGDYPNNTIKGYVYGSGYYTREMCVPLANFFDQLKKLDKKACVLQYKCKITCSLMSHYPYTVGPDMIESALAFEATGETDLAKEYYMAVIKDFERIANEIKDHPEEDVWEEQIIALISLKQAYENSDRLNNTFQYADHLQFLNAVIERGATYSPDENEDE